MKKIISILLTLTFIFTAIPTAFAQTDEYGNTISGDYVYDSDEYGDATIVEYTGDDADVVIPSELDGYNVVGLEVGAFYGNETIESVVIPESVISIGNTAFSDCVNLSSITLQNSKNIVSIGMQAFYNTAWYNAQPDGIVYLDTRALDYKTDDIDEEEGFKNLPQTITIKDGTTHIDSYAFCFSQNLETVVLPESLKSIGAYAFALNPMLSGINIPNGVDTIGVMAFYACYELYDIHLPDSLKMLGSEAFTVSGWYEEQPYGVLYLDNWVTGYKHEYDDEFNPLNSPEEIIIKEGTVGIGVAALSYIDTLKKLTISEGIESIGVAAFVGCENLTDISLPSTLKTIEMAAFSELYALKSIVLPENLQNIEIGAFSDCPSLTIVTIPENVTTIEEYSFGYCYDYENEEIKKVEGFEIHGIAGSAAQAYAEANGFTFVDISDTEPVREMHFTAAVSIYDEEQKIYAVTYEIDKNTAGATAAGMTINFDHTKLEFVGGEISYDAFTDGIPMWNETTANNEGVFNHYAFVNEYDEIITATSGEIVTFYFKLRDGVDSNEQLKITAESIVDDCYIILEPQLDPLVPTPVDLTIDSVTFTPANVGILLGDVNLDGKISIVDARLTLVAIANNETEDIAKLADMNADGKISIVDARQLLMQIAQG